MDNKAFRKSFIKIAVPVTLQALLAASFGLVDQIMIGRLGENPIAGIGIAGKFTSIFSVVVAAVGAVAGIMISQYIGKKDKRAVSRSFFTNGLIAFGAAAVFTLLSAALPRPIMSIYTSDESTCTFATEYLRIMSISFFPIAIGSMFTTLLRCNEKAVLPLVASIFSLALNALLNYLFIFGVGAIPELGVAGAAWATVISQTVSCLIIVVGYIFSRRMEYRLCRFSAKSDADVDKSEIKSRRIEYIKILIPILVCEFLWALGENAYAAIYGNIGTDAVAAMTMTAPVQSMFIGALSGLSQATGILVSKSLGAKDFDDAYDKSKKLMLYGLIGSLVLGAVIAATAPFYVDIYNVGAAVKHTTRDLLFVFSAYFPVKVANMVLGGGIIRSGGKTKYIMCIDIIGTWGFGVPLGLLAAFALGLPIVYVYCILSVEECIRLALGLIVFKRKRWIADLQS